MDNTTLLIWLKRKEAETSTELQDAKERVKILEVQSKLYRDMIAEHEQNNSPADTLASSQDYYK